MNGNNIQLPTGTSGNNFLTYKIDPLTFKVRPVGLDTLTHLKCVIDVHNQKNDRKDLDTVDIYQANSRRKFSKRLQSNLETDASYIERGLLMISAELEKLRAKDEGPSESAPPEIPPQQKKEAIERLKEPDFVTTSIISDYKKCGYIGEELNLLTGYLIATSRKLSHPLSLLISSRSGAGKSWLFNGILSFTPSEDYFRYTQLTDKTLYYKERTELKHKTIALEEKEGADKASYAIKNLLSSGGLSISTVIKEPHTGRMKSITCETEGPSNYVGTTTAVTEMDYETLNRFIILTVNETPEQTALILAKQREAHTLEGIINRRNSWTICSLHHNMQRLLRPLEIVNPYAEKLRFNSNRLIMRRAHMYYLGLIDVIALLHQYQRPIKKASDMRGEFEYIEVTQKDIDIADEIKDKILLPGLDDLVPPARNLLNELKRIIEGNGKGPLTRRQICDRTGWSHYQVRTHINQLIEHQYIGLVSGSNGVKYLYELLDDGNGSKSYS